MAINLGKLKSKIFALGPVMPPQKSKMAGAVIAMSLVAAAATGGYFYSNYLTTKKLEANPEKVLDDQNSKLITEISKIYTLPDSEKPSVATVKDKDKLKSNPLFDTAENGDKILIYSKSRRFVIYRPTTQKLVDVIRISSEQSGQVAGLSTEGQKKVASATPTTVPTMGSNSKDQENKQQAQASATPTPATTPSTTPTPTPVPTASPTQTAAVKVALYNGTKTVGLTKKIEAGLKEKGYTIEVSERADAVGNYDKTQVIDLTGTATETAKKMASDLGGEVVQLPSSEKKPQGEILIIGGSNL
jgi:hypothetical protein